MVGLFEEVVFCHEPHVQRLNMRGIMVTPIPIKKSLPQLVFGGKAMKRLADATGASDANEVVDKEYNQRQHIVIQL
jgi:hypothetical protein